ncbi:UNVERIFIED_ORG: tetratricopeptide (TPR) repeat protein [Rhizobium sp. SORGH_AS260]|nr:tetratricopeptide (TPR) repeat protein [Rhizobium sp. SORGH_AS_0260]MDR6079934.1 tetratricopeptide (TPR) repeat protein [Agrobacterium sp. SORGH_AS_0440]
MYFSVTSIYGADMSTEIPDDQPDEVSLEAAREELHRLLQDIRFRASDRQREILVYLAQRRFAGQRENVKAYSIALDVLGRGADFDASIDPIVRIEISRLRTALATYYSVFGGELGVSIDIPKGSYITVFPANAINAQFDVQDDVLDFTADTAEQPAKRKLTDDWKAKTVVAAAICVVAIVGIWKISERPALTAKPLLRIDVSAVSPELQGDATIARDALMTAVAQFENVIVAATGYDAVSQGRQYTLKLKYYGDSDDRSIWWQLIDDANGNLLKSGLEKAFLEGKAPAGVKLELAGAIARKIAATGGIVNMIEVRDAPASALGNVCIARADVMLNGGGARDRDAVIHCLEQTLALGKQDADVSSTLAKVYAQSADTAGKSLELAGNAVSAAPLSDRAHSALMAARFANGRVDAAIDAGNRALSLNPNNSDTAANLGLVLFSAGYWKAASDLAKEATEMEETPPRNASLVLALEAYRNERWSDSSLYAEQTLGADLLTKSIRVAALAKLGSDSANELLKEAEQGKPDFAIAFRKAANAARLRPELVTALERGLAKAGADFDTVASISHP